MLNIDAAVVTVSFLIHRNVGDPSHITLRAVIRNVVTSKQHRIVFGHHSSQIVMDRALVEAYTGGLGGPGILRTQWYRRDAQQMGTQMIASSSFDSFQLTEYR